MGGESIMVAAMDLFNARASAATGIEEGDHAFADRQQWALTSGGLDIDQEELSALAVTLTEMTVQTAGENPDVEPAAVIADGMRQMFVIGALHEQERARRERDR